MPCKNDDRYVKDGDFVLDTEEKVVYDNTGRKIFEISAENTELDYDKLAEKVAEILKNSIEGLEEEVDKPEIGDVVKINTKNVNDYNYHNFNEDDICWVDEEYDNGFYDLIRVEDGMLQQIEVDDFHKVDSSEAKWVELGREPGEFKEGDVVQVLKERPDGSDLYKNEIGEISKIDEDQVKVNGRIDRVNWARKKHVKLICPVENRVDV